MSRVVAFWKRIRGPFWNVVITVVLVDGLITSDAMKVALAVGVYAGETRRKMEAPR